MLSFQHKVLPSYKVNREKWNAKWEKDISEVYRAAANVPAAATAQAFAASEAKTPMDDGIVRYAAALKGQLCVLQRDLTSKAAKRYAEENFEEVWTQTCSVEERRKWILEGLVRTCEATVEFEPWRQWAPETALDVLQANSGRGFLNLLQAILLPDPGKIPDDYRRIPNAAVEQRMGLSHSMDGNKPLVMPLLLSIQRTLFITTFCWNVILAFYGESQDYGVQTTQSRAKKEIRKRINTDKQALSDALKEEKEARSAVAGAHRCFTTCDLSAEAAGVKSLQACQKCNSIGRLVFYCSKKCQVHDWKCGRPPHKTICGNKEALLHALISEPSTTSTSTFNSRWGEPEPGSVRSPGLCQQLALLEKDPRASYIFIPRGAHVAHGMRSQNPELFETYLRVAMSGSWVDILILHKMLESAAMKISGYGRDGLRRQILEDFGLDPAGSRDAAELVKNTLNEMRVRNPDKWRHFSDASVMETIYTHRIESVPRWGLLKPEHTRSAALLHQLRKLDEDETRDYFLILPRPHPDYGIRFPDRSSFWPVFLRVICSFDPMGVLVLHKMLKPFAVQMPGYGGDTALKKQLFKEFGVDIDKQEKVYASLKRNRV